jgi:hypothetical protein
VQEDSGFQLQRVHFGIHGQLRKLKEEGSCRFMLLVLALMQAAHTACLQALPRDHHQGALCAGFQQHRIPECPEHHRPLQQKIQPFNWFAR